MNPILNLAETKNSKGYSIDSYSIKNGTEEAKKWILSEFIKDETYFKELFEKVSKMNEQNKDSISPEQGQTYFKEVSELKPCFYKYMNYIFSFTRSN